jgi:hypothetical protein
MKNKYLITVLLLVSTGIVGAFSTDTKKFFGTGPDPACKLPADRIYPRGRLFPFSFYSVGGGSETKRGNLLPDKKRLADQREIVAAGITMLGPQYELNDRIVADAKKFKIKAFYTIEPVIDGQKVTREYLIALNKAGKVIDTDKVTKSITDIVKKAAVNKEIAWWDITPEELRYWKDNEKLYLKVATEAIRKADPLKRPVFMYEPNARNAKALSKLASYLDIIGKGMYTNYSGMKKSRVWCRWTIEQEIEAIKMSGRGNAIPIALPEMFQQPANGELSQINTWARHDAYAALIAGAKGIVIFSASRRPNFTARTAYLKSYLKICKELTGKLNLGQVFLFGERRKDISISILDGPETVTLKGRRINKKYPSIGMANIAYKNCRYVFLVNSSSKPVEAVVGGLVYGSGITIQDVFDPKQKFTAPEGDFEVELKPLEVKAYIVFNAK